MIPTREAKVHDDVTVKWTRATGNGPPIERWFAGVALPTYTEAFAQVERIDGRWWLILFTGHAGAVIPN